MDDAHWHGVLDLNLSSAFYASRAALAVMPDGGRIITIGAQAARSGGGTGMVAYSTAKAALEGFSRALARELVRGGSPSTSSRRASSPAPRCTRRTRPSRRSGPRSSASPLNRAGAADDVAEAVVYLASDGASFVTGMVLDVNGGA